MIAFWNKLDYMPREKKRPRIRSQIAKPEQTYGLNLPFNSEYN